MTRKLPPLPKSVHAPAGPVRVVRKAKLTDDDGRSLAGLWIPNERLICIDRSLSLDAAWGVLQHEKFHAWLDDIGVTFSDQEHKRLEHICDGLAAARMNEMWWEMLRKHTR